jgi:hypothetical protein
VGCVAGCASGASKALAKELGSRRDLPQPEEVADPIESVEADLFVNETATGANHGLPIAINVPRKAETRAEIVVIAAKGRTDLLADLSDPGRGAGIEVTDQVIALLRGPC